MARTAKKKIAIYDEGILLVEDVDQLNFAGAGVSGTNPLGNNVTETIGGGGGGASIETPSGTINGVNTIFTVSNAPSYIVIDGVSKFVTLNYTYAAGTITITDGAPPIKSIRSFY